MAKKRVKTLQLEQYGTGELGEHLYNCSLANNVLQEHSSHIEVL